MILPNGVGTIDSDYRGELKVLATWIGEGIHLLWAKANVLHKCCSGSIGTYRKLISVPWSQQNEALVDSVHLDNTEERTCNPLMYILGIVEYTDALEMMSTLQQQRINDDIPDTILFWNIQKLLRLGQEQETMELHHHRIIPATLSIEEVALPGTDLANLLFIRSYIGTRTTRNPLQISSQKSNPG